MKIKISKSKWLSMGLNKSALAAPISDEKARELAELGYYTEPSLQDSFPKGGKTRHQEILEQTGAGELFGDRPIRFRTHYIPKIKNLVVIDGQEYILAHVEKSTKKIDGKIYVYGPVVHKENGSIDWGATGHSPKEFSYNDYIDQVKRSPATIQDKIDLINEFADRHNEFVEKQKDKKFGTLTVLPLQIKWAENMLSNRINAIKSGENYDDNDEEKSKKIQKGREVIEDLRSDIIGGKSQVSPSDYAVALLETKFHSVSSLEQLAGEIKTIKMPFDNKTNSIIKQYLEKVIEWQIETRKSDESSKKLEKGLREERKESDLDEMKELLLQKIKRITELPGQYYKAQGYFSPETMVTQKHEISESRKTDLEELEAVYNALTHARQTIIDLPSASNEYLRGEGSARMGQIQSFIDNAKIFIKRYKQQVLIPDGDELKINPKLFGAATGSIGNALIAIILNQIILSVEGEINRINNIVVPQVKTPTESPSTVSPSPASISETIASNKNNLIQKISLALWNSFKERKGI